MELLPNLKKLGLSENEAKVYLSLLGLDQAPVSIIASRAEVKRPTCYLILEELFNKNLIERIPVSGKQHFKAKPVDSLVANYQEKLNLAKEMVPMLASISSQDPFSPKVKLYEGRSGMDKLYSDFLLRSKKAKNKDVMWFANLEQLEHNFPGLMDKFQRFYVSNKIKKRELVKVGEKSRHLIAKYTDNLNEFRVVPDNFPIGIDFGITESEVVIFAQQAPLFGLSVEHKSTTGSFRSLFELAWLGTPKNTGEQRN